MVGRFTMQHRCVGTMEESSPLMYSGMLLILYVIERTQSLYSRTYGESQQITYINRSYVWLKGDKKRRYKLLGIGFFVASFSFQIYG